MKRFLLLLPALLLTLIPTGLYPQTGDEFGFDSATFTDSSVLAPALSGVTIGGEVSAELLGFVDDFDSPSSIDAAALGNVFSGALNFSVSGSVADAAINLRLAPTDSPASIDEAYARVYFGPVNIEGGLRKLTWGRADSYGPLDVINPLDYTDLTKISDPLRIKLARPLLHISWGIGSFSKLEGVFVPVFRGHRFALDGRWAPSQITGLSGAVSTLFNGLVTAYSSQYQSDLAAKLTGLGTADLLGRYWDSNPGLQYAQAGLRFTTSIGSSDFGAQYYYGRLPRPALNIEAKPGFITPIPNATTVNIDLNQLQLIDYNSYHQIGLDFARIIAGFNTRAEAAVNLTEDLAGDKPDIYNPSVAWSLGFDRDVIAGINLNLQAVETIRLFHDKIGTGPAALDTEGGKDVTSTRITLILSKKFFRDRLELEALGLWDIEDPGFLIMPGVIYSNDDVAVELKYGAFFGKEEGELGQYRDNQFVRLALTYSF